MAVDLRKQGQFLPEQPDVQPLELVGADDDADAVGGPNVALCRDHGLGDREPLALLMTDP